MDKKLTTGVKSVFQLYAIFFGMLLTLVLLAFLMAVYVIAVRLPDGSVGKSSWPLEFTQAFEQQIMTIHDRPQIKQSGLDQLHKYGLWLQIIDESGKEVYAYRKPDSVPSSYSASMLLALTAASPNGKTSQFIGRLTDQANRYTYIIGFPLSISVTTTYFNGDHFTNGKSFYGPLLWTIAGFILAFGLLYGLWITNHLKKIARSIQNITDRTHHSLPETSLFADVYASLNKLDREIRAGDDLREETDRMREEWIANITHDLKTPLSPIRGYAELIADPDYQGSSEEIQAYGRIIQRNVAYADRLINDLKLIYQLENGMVPLRMEKVNLVRFLKEIAIDILNDPEYAGKHIDFERESTVACARIDTLLMRRGVYNVLVNAFVHNPPDVDVRMCVKQGKKVEIEIQDSGQGLTQEQQENLFRRYYRGSGTDAKAEGTGLGLAIAKQIVELHGGRIAVQSIWTEGTTFRITLPCEN